MSAVSINLDTDDQCSPTAKNTMRRAHFPLFDLHQIHSLEWAALSRPHHKLILSKVEKCLSLEKKTFLELCLTFALYKHVLLSRFEKHFTNNRFEYFIMMLFPGYFMMHKTNLHGHKNNILMNTKKGQSREIV